MQFTLALRNVLRNKRRSVVTSLAIAIGMCTLALFWAYATNIILSFETGTIIRTGHLNIYKRGYSEYGAGNPSAYGIGDYDKLIEMIQHSSLNEHIKVITPVIYLYGLASNTQTGNTKNFYGIGWVQHDHDDMLSWDDYGIQNNWWHELTKYGTGLTHDPKSAVVGDGLAKVIGLCVEGVKCREVGRQFPSISKAILEPTPTDIQNLTRRVEQSAARTSQPNEISGLDLLTATEDGSPNAARVDVVRAVNMSVKELSDVYIGLHFDLAKKLLYGHSNKATSIIIQLGKTSEIEPVREQLSSMFAKANLDLEIKDFREVTPLYKQIIALFGSIFGFISIIIAVISAFIVVNTMTMCVIERTQEIGTLRALGIGQQSLRNQFVIEGVILGAIGVALGLAVAIVVAQAVNLSGVTWTPPGNATPIPLVLLIKNSFSTSMVIAGLLILTAGLAAYLPTRKATRMIIVDALRHA